MGKRPARGKPGRNKTARAQTILFNKPYGVVSQFTPAGGHKTLGDFGLPSDVYPAGRLDADSEGLMILTSEGRIQHKISSPRFSHPRTYLVQVERIPEPEALERLAAGLKLKDGKTRPCKVQLLEKAPGMSERVPPIRERKNVPTAWLELTLTEGRNRQVRRMTAAVGHPTLRLVRVRMGKLGLGGVRQGQWRELGPQEIAAF